MRNSVMLRRSLTLISMTRPQMPEPVNVHEGTIPVIYQGRLLLGIDVSANIILESANTAETIT